MSGSTNFLVFNPADTEKTDSDADYAAETQRTGGLQGGIAKTAMHNKFYRQMSVMVAAFAQAMANQGQTVSDADVNALVTVIANSFMQRGAISLGVGVDASSYVWQNGVHACATTVSGMPVVGHSWIVRAEASDANNVYLYAIDLSAVGNFYVRQKIAGAWQAWVSQAFAIATDFVAHSTDNTKHTPYTVTSHVGNAYSATVPNLIALTDGYPLCVKFDAASTGSITLNTNGLGAKSVVDYFGNAVANVRANLIANLRYDSVSGNFILLGKGGGGNAIASNLLSGKLATVDDGPITGIMIDKSGSETVITPSAVDQAIQQGYYPGGLGDGKVAAVVVPASKVMVGTTIAGTPGELPNRIGSGLILTPSAVDQAIPIGGYDGLVSSGKVAGVYVPPANVLTGTTIAGTAGAMPNRSGDTAALANAIAGTTLKLRATNGYRDGIDDNVTITDADFIAANIINGKDIFGLLGTARLGYFASGESVSTPDTDSYNTDTSASSTLSKPSIYIAALGFIPDIFIAIPNANGTSYYPSVYFNLHTVRDTPYSTALMRTFMMGIAAAFSTSMDLGGSNIPVQNASTLYLWYAFKVS